MPVLASGNSTSLTLGTFDSITLQNRAGQSASLTIAGVLVNGAHSGTRTYGPYASGGAVSITATAGDVYYEVADGSGQTAPVFYREDGTIPGSAAAAVAATVNGRPMPKWAKAVAGVRAGVSRAKVLVIGDSTTAGDGSNNTALGLKSKSYPAYLASILTGRGLACTTASAFGGSGKGSTANIVTWDPRFTFGAGWGINAAQTLGGGLLANTTDTTTMAFAPGVAFDTIDIWYYQQAANGTFTVNIGAGTLATVNSATGGTAYVKTTVSTGGAAAASTVNIQRNGTGGGVYIGGISCYDSANPSVSVWNAGWSSSTSTVWSSTSSVFSPIQAIGIMAPDLTIIDLGINDWNSGAALATYLTNMQAVITAALASGDVILKSGVQSNPANFASVATQEAFIAGIEQLATTNGLSLVRSTDEIGGYTAAAANGYMYDDRHPLAIGYARIASPVADLLLAGA